MTKDAEIEQVLSLPEEKWQRKKLRLPHSQKREAEKPQKRRSREPTLLKDYRRFCQSESDVHGSETEIRGSECKKTWERMRKSPHSLPRFPVSLREISTTKGEIKRSMSQHSALKTPCAMKH